MRAADKDRIRIIECNQREYGEGYARLRWISDQEASSASDRRREVLAFLAGHVRFGYKDTKLDCRRLSPGCERCGDGTWSCLFINGKCNCRCFYCPSKQQEIALPTTNTLPFPKTGDYLDYIERFSFRGVSISGGEPFLTFPRTLSFVTAVKRRYGEGVHMWLYTNGTLAVRDMLCRLRDAGLDEIRFNIGAVRYDLERVREAVGTIRNVTVEIPAIPEDYDLMKLKIQEMEGIGVNHLNLHQLRLTPYNFEYIAPRPYTFLHGEKVTVLESELAALNLISYALAQGILLPINYCSFAYKNRFQKAAARRRSAQLIRKGHEDITESGFIRSLFLAGDSEALGGQAVYFERQGLQQGLWSLDVSRNRLYCSSSLWGAISFEKLRPFLVYSEARLLPALSYCNPFLEITLNKGRRIVVERVRVSDEIELDREDSAWFEDLVIYGKDEDRISGQLTEKQAGILKWEAVESGLQKYF